ncbi:MAG: Fic family protein [Psychromonas sp.]
MVKYDINTAEGEYQSGSNGKVLKNLLDLTDESEMNEAETALLFKLYEYLFSEKNTFAKPLSVAAIIDWHRKWLGNVYQWAGDTRTVNMGKGGFEFAAALQVPRLLREFDKNYLAQSNELENLNEDELVDYLAKVHVEFILIHPFCEGNGRLSRLLLDVLVFKAGYEPLDYSLWDKHKDFYLKSIQAGASGNYEYMERLVRDVLKTVRPN